MPPNEKTDKKEFVTQSVTHGGPRLIIGLERLANKLFEITHVLGWCKPGDSVNKININNTIQKMKH